MDSRRKGLALVSIGTLFFSTSPVITRFISDIPVGQIAFFRMFFAAVFVFVMAKFAKVSLKIKPSDIYKFALYGLITALHFLLYIASLMYTTIAHSLSLVYTAPVMIAIMASRFFKEPLSKYKYFGIFMVILGITILAGFETEISEQMLLGDLMALGSAFTMALYSLAGRLERSKNPLLFYVFWVYLFSALFLLPAAVNSSIKITGTQWILLLLLGIFPTGLGHTLYNLGLRYAHPTYANLIMSQEITGGIVLGYVAFGEMPGINVFIGIVIMFIGLFQVLHEKARPDFK